jgi:hypothetical protein
VVPRKPPNPCIASMERRDLHRELAFHQKTWVVSVVIHACQTKQNIKKKAFSNWIKRSRWRKVYYRFVTENDERRYRWRPCRSNLVTLAQRHRWLTRLTNCVFCFCSCVVPFFLKLVCWFSF